MQGIPSTYHPDPLDGAFLPAMHTSDRVHIAGIGRGGASIVAPDVRPWRGGSDGGKSKDGGDELHFEGWKCVLLQVVLSLQSEILFSKRMFETG
jgi:hypothetical protein